MEIQFDWAKIHDSILFEQKAGEKSAQIAARQIEHAIREEGRPVGTVLGTSPALCDRFNVGRETLLEAIRLLEVRGVAKMRRGRFGGLVSLAVPETAAVDSIRRHLALLRLTQEQLCEARRAFELFAAYDLLAQQGQESVFESLFLSLIADGRSPLAHPLPSRFAQAPIRNRALKAFVDAVDALGTGSGAEPQENSVCDSAGSELVKLTQDYLVGEMQRMQADGIEKLGNEAQIAERIGVSRQVLRQAMRLLEEQGLLACRRGRSNGIVAPAAHPASLVGTITQAFERDGVRDDEYRPVMFLFDRINRCQFSCKAEPEHFTALEKLVLGRDWGNASTGIRRMHIEWPVIDNPVLSLIEQALAAYRARRAGTLVIVTSGDIGALQQNSVRHLARLRARDLAGADQLNRTMQDQIAKLLGAY